VLVGRGRVCEVQAGVGGGFGLEAPACGQRAGVDGVEAEAVEEIGRLCLRARVVPGDGQGAAVGSAGRAGELRDVVGEDVVERFDERGPGEVPLNEFAGRQLLVVEFSDPAVTERVVVAGVEQGLALERWRTGRLYPRYRSRDPLPSFGRCRVGPRS